jgi:16S rRNA (adenine1518-N6/adenine1519-N6)-dimethyltransferase
MTFVRAKKNLGQHFLADDGIARQIVESLSGNYRNVLEVGPGMGVLTKYLFEINEFNTIAVDVDRESVSYLRENFPSHSDQIVHDDFLKMDIASIFGDERFVIIGNFPYNISSQILFKIFENKNKIPEMVGMFQKEVAERIAAKPGSKTYGILSVLLQAYFNIEYLFTVSEHVFRPPPKVKSAVIRVRRNEINNLGCNEVLFKQVVKTAFNQRRKMIRNSIKSLLKEENKAYPFMEKRPEQLSVAEFVELTNAIEGIQ